MRLLTAAVCLTAALIVLGCASQRTVENSAESAFRVLSDQRYASQGSVDLLADIYLPQRPGPLPAVVMIHGGGWYKGSRGQMARYGERLAERGFVVANISYRFAPEHRFPAQIHDVKEAVRWLRANATEYQVNPDKIAAFGYSAGAHLALLLALTDSADSLEGNSAYPGTSSHVTAAIAGGAPIDLTRFEANETFDDFIGVTLNDANLDAYRRASPITYLNADSPPLFLYHGRNDWIVPIEQSELLHEQAKALGVDVELRKNLLGHVATYFLADGPLEDGIAFLNRALNDDS